jgi:hypothetical protein
VRDQFLLIRVEIIFNPEEEESRCTVPRVPCAP